MASKAPPSNEKAPKTKPQTPEAPTIEPEFWKHYSPHGEAPLSAIGSLMLHALVIGGGIILAVYFGHLFFKPTVSLPVEPVRLFNPGGGGARSGTAGDAGGGGEPVEATGENPKDIVPNQDVPKDRPVLNKVELSQIKENYDPESTRYIRERSSEATKAFASLEDSTRRKLAEGLRSQGEGGGGDGGGTGEGDGKGKGSGKGDQKAKLTIREKRMLRWHMQFTATTGTQYLAQLRDLGAILAFPVRENPEPEYEIVRDLKPGAKLLKEDLNGINRIYWIDNKPNSVQDILGALAITLPRLPSRFVAFMPEALEKKLYEMEKDYVVRVLRQPFNEDKIEDTVFEVVPSATGFKPQIRGVRLR
jgi:hypothetical protein